MSSSCVTITMVMARWLRLEHGHDFGAGAAVEIARRLVGQQDRGSIDNRTGDGYALLFAPGKLVRMMVGSARQADQFKRLHRPIASRARAEPAGSVQHRQLNILQRRSASQQMKALKDETDFLVADVGQLIVIKARDVHALQEISSRRRAVETADEVHERGFS